MDFNWIAVLALILALHRTVAQATPRLEDGTPLVSVWLDGTQKRKRGPPKGPKEAGTQEEASLRPEVLRCIRRLYELLRNHVQNAEGAV